MGENLEKECYLLNIIYLMRELDLDFRFVYFGERKCLGYVYVFNKIFFNIIKSKNGELERWLYS